MGLGWYIPEHPFSKLELMEGVVSGGGQGQVAVHHLGLNGSHLPFQGVDSVLHALDDGLVGVCHLLNLEP